MATNMTREQKIHWLGDKLFDDLQMSVEVQDGRCRYVLINGLKGLKDYTNDELEQKYKEWFDEYDHERVRGYKKNV